jgi:hypothetical protein
MKMPTPYLKKLSKQGYGSLDKLESKWEEAKAIAAKDGHEDDYALITSIFKKIAGIKKKKKKKKKKVSESWEILNVLLKNREKDS